MFTGGSGSMPFDLEDEYDEVHTAVKISHKNMPSNILDEINEKLVEIVNLMNSSKHPPKKNDYNR